MGADTRVARLRERARQGDAPAQFDVGSLYKLGEGVPRDPVRALGYMLLAAGQGDVDAMIQVTLLQGELRLDQIERAERWAQRRE